MAITVFKDSTYNLGLLIDDIRRGEIALPDIQRPFVWKTTKVRDLFDSMYKGFPVGFLLFWSTGAEVGARMIGVGEKEAAPRLMIVDGQQRLTSLYAVLTGQPIVKDDYSESRIRIAFRPRDAHFEVADSATEKDPEFLPDISVLWNGGGGRRKVVRGFLKRLSASRGALAEDETDELEESLDRLFDIRNYPFKVVELEADVPEEQVADVFVRINSEGVRLSQADFILTLMSVWWDKGRKQLEEFARACREAIPRTVTPANPFIDPGPDQLLRVTAGVAFKRGRLQYVYQVLRGKDLETGEVSPESRERQFAALRNAQEATLDLTNWHEFLKAVRRAGYRSRSMITSENNLLFSYLMYLVGRRECGVGRHELREVIARWFFMSAMTGRYTGSFETRVEADLRRVEKASSADEFITALDSMIDTELTGDYWTIRLPAALETSAAWSPTLFAYHASLVLLNAQALFSRLTISELLDPSSTAPRAAVERHHLFPRAYLAKIGIERSTERNQIANYAFVEWPDNIEIGDSAPSDYFPSLFAERLNEDERLNAYFWHALPEGWQHMEYADFLEHRRFLIAEVIRAAFEKLRTGDLPFQDAATTEASATTWSLEDLISEAETETVEFKSSAYYSYRPDIPERVVTESVVKAVAGFMNAGGGTLAIGVGDDGEILGIRPDLDLKNMDTDRYVNALTTVLERAMGAACSTLARIRIENAEEQQVCVISVAKAAEPAFAKVSKGDNVFYVRINNSTRVLEGPDLLAYIRQRWG